jgi:hypothetical protein
MLLSDLRVVLVESLESLKFRIIPSASRDTLNSSFLLCINFISFSCLISLAKKSRTIMNKSGENGHFVLFLLLKEMSSVFPHLLECWQYGCIFCIHCIEIYSLQFVISLWIYHKKLLYFVKGFFCIYSAGHVTFVLCLFLSSITVLICVCWTILVSLKWNQLDHGVWMNFSMYCWTWFAGILLGILHQVSLKKSVYTFLFVYCVLI